MCRFTTPPRFCRYCDADGCWRFPPSGNRGNRVRCRGGGDKGFRWYQGGSRGTRIRGVEDLEAVAGKLAAKRPVCLSSNSAGAIVAGALLNRTRVPIQGVLLHVPFLLLKDTLSNRDLPLTMTEFDEWGNPENAEEMKGIDAICPYTNLRKRNYPNMFLTCGRTR